MQHHLITRTLERAVLMRTFPDAWRAMLDLLWRVRFRWQVRPKRAVGDTTYGTIENIRTLEDAGIRAYVPLPNFDARTPYYGASRFHYDPEQDAYRCPQGQPLQRWKTVSTGMAGDIAPDQQQRPLTGGDGRLRSALLGQFPGPESPPLPALHPSPVKA